MTDPEELAAVVLSAIWVAQTILSWVFVGWICPAPILRIDTAEFMN